MTAGFYIAVADQQRIVATLGGQQMKLPWARGQSPCPSVAGQADGRILVHTWGMGLPPCSSSLGPAAPPGQPIFAHGIGAAPCQHGHPPAVRHGGLSRWPAHAPIWWAERCQWPSFTPHNRGKTPDIVRHIGEPPLREGATLETVVVLGTTKHTMGHTLQSLGERPLMAFPAGLVPEGLLRAPTALFPAAGLEAGEPPPEEPAGMDLDLDLEVGADEDNECLLS